MITLLRLVLIYLQITSIELKVPEDFRLQFPFFFFAQDLDSMISKLRRGKM